MTVLTLVLASTWLLTCSADKTSPDNSMLDQKLISGLRSNSTEDPKDRVIRKIEYIKSICGSICDTDRDLNEAYFNAEAGFYEITKEFNCHHLYAMSEVHDLPDHPNMQQPFEQIPKSLRRDFSYGWRIKLRPIKWYINSNFGQASDATEHFEEENINKLMRQFARNDFTDGVPYGAESGEELYKSLSHMDLKDKTALVVGSQSPWIEAMVLNQGAKLVITLDYSKIVTNHPKVKAYQPTEFNQAYLNKTLEKIDAIVTYSSLEHSGLGRYGDGLHPWGDLVTMAKLWCILPPGAQVLVGIPSGMDTLNFNVHRCYGKVMLSHLFANFKYVWSYGPGVRIQMMSDRCRLFDFIQSIVLIEKV